MKPGPSFGLPGLFLAAGLLALGFGSTGCGGTSEDTFFWDKNYRDEPLVKGVVDDLTSGINTRSMDLVLKGFRDDFASPDPVDDRVRHNVQTLRAGYQDFFRKAETIDYAIADRHVTMSENGARVTFTLRQKFKANSPFSYTLDREVADAVWLSKSDGRWFITRVDALLPPVIR